MTSSFSCYEAVVLPTRPQLIGVAIFLSLSLYVTQLSRSHAMEKLTVDDHAIPTGKHDGGAVAQIVTGDHPTSLHSRKILTRI